MSLTFMNYFRDVLSDQKNTIAKICKSCQILTIYLHFKDFLKLFV